MPSKEWMGSGMGRDGEQEKEKGGELRLVCKMRK